MRLSGLGRLLQGVAGDQCLKILQELMQNWGGIGDFSTWGGKNATGFGGLPSKNDAKKKIPFF